MIKAARSGCVARELGAGVTHLFLPRFTIKRPVAVFASITVRLIPRHFNSLENQPLVAAVK